MAKLTLNVDEETIRTAKTIARLSGASVSDLFSRYIRSLAVSNPRDIKPGPNARKAWGMFKLPPGKSDRELLTEALEEKYGLRK